MKKKKELTTTQYYLIIFSIFIAFVGLLAFSYIKLNSSVSEVSKQLAVLDKYETEELKITSLIKDYSGIESSKETLEETIPSKEKLVDLIEQIENIAAILDLDASVGLAEGVVDEEGVVVDIASESVKRINKYAGITNVESLEVGVTMRVLPDDFGQVMNFIGMLRDLKYYNKVISQKFMTTIDDKGNEYLDVVLTLALYVKSGNN